MKVKKGTFQWLDNFVLTFIDRSIPTVLTSSHILGSKQKKRRKEKEENKEKLRTEREVER